MTIDETVCAGLTSLYKVGSKQMFEKWFFINVTSTDAPSRMVDPLSRRQKGVSANFETLMLDEQEMVPLKSMKIAAFASQAAAEQSSRPV